MKVVRGNIPKQLFNEKNSEKTRLINFVVEICKRNNIGKRVEHQRMIYSKDELEVLRKIVKFVLWIFDNEIKNFRTLKETEQLINILIKSLKNNKKILIFALFCPGYKKGKNVYGFKEQIGDTTKRGFKYLDNIFREAKTLGIKVIVKAIYSDLVLENFGKLNKKDFEKLEKNFQNFKKYGEKLNSEIEILKISDIGRCKEKIGIRGIVSGKIPLSKRDINRIVRRSFPFYRGVLGWKEKEIIKRTKDLARSCSFMAKEITKDRDSIMVMVENIYERAKFYQAENKNMPIFYPKKC